MYRLTFSMPDIWLIKEGLPSDVSTGDQALFYITRESLVSYSSISGNLVVFVEAIRPLNEREKIHLFLRDGYLPTKVLKFSHKHPFCVLKVVRSPAFFDIVKQIGILETLNIRKIKRVDSLYVS